MTDTSRIAMLKAALVEQFRRMRNAKSEHTRLMMGLKSPVTPEAMQQFQKDGAPLLEEINQSEDKIDRYLTELDSLEEK